MFGELIKLTLEELNKYKSGDYKYIFEPNIDRPNIQAQVVVGARRGYVSQRDLYCARQNLIAMMGQFFATRYFWQHPNYIYNDRIQVVSSEDTAKKIEKVSGPIIIVGGPEPNELTDLLIQKYNLPVGFVSRKNINITLLNRKVKIKKGELLSSEKFELIAKYKKYKYIDVPYGVAELDERWEPKKILGSFKTNEKIRGVLKEVTTVLVIYDDRLIIAGSMAAGTSSVVLSPSFLSKIDPEGLKNLIKEDLSRAVIVLKIVFKDRIQTPQDIIIQRPQDIKNIKIIKILYL